MTSKVSISQYKEEILRPQVKGADLEKLIPAMSPVNVSFKMAGTNNAFANAFVNAISCEVPAKSLNVMYESITTDDEFIIPEMLILRLKLIPVNQSVPLSTTFTLNVINKSAIIRDVKMDEFKSSVGGNLPFNGNFTLCTLRPMCALKISAVNILVGKGVDHAAFNLAYLCASIPEGNPFNPLTGEGESCSVANPRAHTIKFSTNGQIPAKELIRAACKVMTEKLADLQTMIADFETVGDKHVLNVAGESIQFGNALIRAIYDTHPDIPFAAITDSSFGRGLTIKLRTEKLAETLTSAINSMQEQLEVITASF